MGLADGLSEDAIVGLAVVGGDVGGGDGCGVGRFVGEAVIVLHSLVNLFQKQ